MYFSRKVMKWPWKSPRVPSMSNATTGVTGALHLLQSIAHLLIDVVHKYPLLPSTPTTCPQHPRPTITVVAGRLDTGIHIVRRRSLRILDGDDIVDGAFPVPWILGSSAIGHDVGMKYVAGQSSRFDPN